MILVPFAIARGRDPRTPFEKSYSDASCPYLALYLWLTFGLLHSLGSDDSGSWRPLHKGHNQEATARDRPITR